MQSGEPYGARRTYDAGSVSLALDGIGYGGCCAIVQVLGTLQRVCRGRQFDGPCTCMALVFIVCGSAHRSFSEHAALAVWLRLDGGRHVGAGEWACLQRLRDACIEGWRLKLLKYKKVAAKGDWLRSVARQLPARGACDFLAQQTRDSMVVKIVGRRALGRGGAASAKVADPPATGSWDMCHTYPRSSL